MKFSKKTRLISMTIFTIISNSIFAQTATQSLWAWGNNYFGQLGLGNNSGYDTTSATRVLDSSSIKVIKSGYAHTVKIKNDGTLWAWGRNDYGQLGLGDSKNYNIPKKVGTDTNWINVGTGMYHTLAIKKDGTLWSWGRNIYGQLGLGNYTDYNSPQQIDTASDWLDIAITLDGSYAIKNNGTLWSWGVNQYGQLGLGNSTTYNSPHQVGSDSNWHKVTCNASHALAIKNDGTLWGWGSNAYCQLGLGNSTTSTNFNIPQQVGTDSTWVDISTGYLHTIGIKSDGTLWSWGYNGNGQLGLGSNTLVYNSPTKLGVESSWKTVSTMYAHNIAMKKNGTLWSWGYNGNGQLGLGNKTNYNSPQQIGNDSNWTTITSGWEYSIAMKKTPCKIILSNKSKHKKLAASDTLTACSSLKLTTKNKKYKSYRWNTGDTTLYTSVNKSRLVTLRETDSKGCVNIDTVYVRLLKDEISQAPDTSICSVKANDTLKLNLINWFGKADYNFYNRLKIQSTNADVFIKNSASKKWTGLAALKSNTAVKCPVSGNIYPSVVYPRLVNKLTDTILTTKSALKPSVVDKKYTKYTWSNNDTTWTTNFNNSGNYWFKQMDSVGCSQTDTFHFSRINLTIPSKITAKFGSKILLKVKDSLNSSSYVVWSTGDTSWHTVYTVTKNTDTIFATQQDAYRSVTKFTVITGRLEPIRTIEEYDNFDNDSAGNTKSQNNTAGIEVSNLVNLRIYPNPVGSEITLEGLTYTMNYEIHTITGQLVQSGKTSTKINVENLQTGLYLLKLENVSVKFVKE